MTVGGYFTGQGGTGTAYAPGDIIDGPGTTTIYIYNEDNGCSSESSFEVTILQLEALPDLGSNTVCGSFTLPQVASGEYYTGLGGTGAQLAPGDEITESGTYYLYTTNGVCSDEEAFMVTIATPPVVIAPDNVDSCGPYQLPALPIGAYYTEQGGSGQELAPGSTIETSQDLYVYAESPILNSCSAEESFTISITTPPELPDFEDGTLCITQSTGPDSPIILGMDLGPDVIYDWTPNNDTNGDGVEEATFEVVRGGTYTLELYTRVNGVLCTDGKVYSATITESVAPLAIEASLSINGYRLGDGNVVTLAATSPNGELDAFEYALDLDGPWQASPEFTDLLGGIYTGYVRSVTGCGTVMASEPFMIVNYPTVFSPNGDGINDTWKVLVPEQLGTIENMTINIHDRYGKLLKQLKPREFWDGTYGNLPMPSSDYWFSTDINANIDGTTQFLTFKGHFSLIR